MGSGEPPGGHVLYVHYRGEPPRSYEVPLSSAEFLKLTTSTRINALPTEMDTPVSDRFTVLTYICIPYWSC